jgi:hypothetical protein
MYGQATYGQDYFAAWVRIWVPVGIHGKHLEVSARRGNFTVAKSNDQEVRRRTDSFSTHRNRHFEVPDRKDDFET